jgi:DNA-binding NtrC family response regulator
MAALVRLGAWWPRGRRRDREVPRSGLAVTAAGGGPVLLIVDDEPVIARGLSLLFRRRGYVVHTAESAATALDVLRREPIDVMVVDFRIPDMRGDVLFAAAAAIQPKLEVRTIFVTGDISDTVTDALGETICPVVLKPFDMAELERVVQSVVARTWRPRGLGEADGGATAC